MKSFSLNSVGWLVLAGGVLATIPSACVLVADLPDADVQVALVPVIRIPLESLNKSRAAKAAFQVPFRWESMRADWGDPVYVVMGRDARSKILPFEKLGVHVVATVAGRPLNLERPTYQPYGYFFDDGEIGVIFKPDPGDQVVLDVSVPEGIQVPAGELEVVGFSDSYTKDRVVGFILTEDFRLRAWSKSVLSIGVALITIGALIVFATRDS
jgi:hypothetical protein